MLQLRALALAGGVESEVVNVKVDAFTGREAEAASVMVDAPGGLPRNKMTNDRRRTHLGKGAGPARRGQRNGRGALTRLWPRCILVPCLAVACGSADTGTIALLIGGESDALTQSPAPTTFLVELIDSSGTASTVATVAAGAGTVDLADESEDNSGTFRVTGLDATNTARVQGYSLPVDLSTLPGATLDIFVQRIGQLARMPNPLSDARPSPVLATSVGRYLFIAGGGDPTLAASSQLYDFETYAPVASPPKLPIAPTTVAFNGTIAYLINDQGGALIDLADSTTATLSLPADAGAFTFADVSGGATIALDDGESFIVGCTRVTGAATSSVLYVDVNGLLNLVTLSAPRLGCGATYVTSVGLIVTGGSASAPGVEVVQETVTDAGATLVALTGTTLAYPPDPSTGVGVAGLDGTHVLLVGGSTPAGDDPGARYIDVTCADSSCDATAWSTVTFPAVLTTAQAFGLDSLSAFIVGNDSTGSTHAFTVTVGGVTAVPLKVPRNNARVVPIPTYSYAIVGGAAEIESFIRPSSSN